MFTSAVKKQTSVKFDRPTPTSTCKLMTSFKQKCSTNPTTACRSYGLFTEDLSNYRGNFDKLF